jgi:hypothetical protein
VCGVELALVHLVAWHAKTNLSADPEIKIRQAGAKMPRGGASLNGRRQLCKGAVHHRPVILWPKDFVLFNDLLH